MSQDITSHQEWFAAFTDGYRRAEQQDVMPLDLKVEHTRAVLDHTRLLTAEGAIPPPLHRTCLLAALYHDVARFPQYARWHTFKDSLSANHGLLGIKVLKKHACLDAEDPVVRARVLAAVGMHNRFAVPRGLSPELRLVVDAVRDADKLDIFRIMAGHLAGEPPYNEAVVLHVLADPDLWSPAVVRSALQGQVASYAQLTSVNDLRVLLSTWMFDLRFAATRRQLARSGLVPLLLAPLPPVPALQEARHYLLDQLERVCA